MKAKINPPKLERGGEKGMEEKKKKENEGKEVLEGYQERGLMARVVRVKKDKKRRN